MHVYARPKSRKNQMSGLHGHTKAAVMKVTAFMSRPKDRKWWKIISMSLPFWSAGGFVSIIPTPFEYGLKMPGRACRPSRIEQTRRAIGGAPGGRAIVVERSLGASAGAGGS